MGICRALLIFPSHGHGSAHAAEPVSDRSSPTTVPENARRTLTRRASFDTNALSLLERTHDNGARDNHSARQHVCSPRRMRDRAGNAFEPLATFLRCRA
jgi:hypothetical protein